MSSRRTVLAGAALLSLSGCLSPTGSSTSEPTPEPTPSPTDTPTDLPGGGGTAGETRPAGTGGPAAIVASVDDQSDLPLAYDVTVTDGVATEEHPPLLTVSLTNTGEERVAVGEARAAVFEYVYSDDDYLVLLPADGEYDADPGCWRLDSPVATTQEYRTETIGPGESFSTDFALYAAGVEADACLPVGEHHFGSSVTRYGDSEEVGAGGETAEWGFTLLLE